MSKKVVKLNFDTTDESLIEHNTEKQRQHNLKVREATKTREQKIREYKRKILIQKIVVIVIFSIFSVSMLVFGTYNTFLKQDTPLQEIYKGMNKFNNETQFPDNGVEGYLKENINEIFINYITPHSVNNIDTYKVDEASLYVTDINKKSYNIANVYFKARIDSKERDIRKGDDIIVGANHSNWYSFYLPILYDFNLGYYQRVGDLEVLMWEVENKSELSKVGNPYLDFPKEMEKYEQDGVDYTSAKLFLDNFFKNLINNKLDVSLEYGGGSKLDIADRQVTYDSISEMTFYKTSNVEGFNVKLNYKLLTSDGLAVNNLSYVSLEKNGDSWKILRLR